jgi:uncharacterized protein YjgD (DUF1641 family)
VLLQSFRNVSSLQNFANFSGDNLSNLENFFLSSAADQIFNENDSTQTLFETIAKPIVANVLNGINGTIIAYGNTSSGKTFTMMGDETERGVIELAAQEIFEIIKDTPDREYLLSVAYFEIYNETIKDLVTQKMVVLKLANQSKIF